MGKNFYSGCILLLLAFLCTECDLGVPENQGILVSTEWLQNQLHDPDLVVLHAGTREGYDSLHIPGARLIIPGTFTVEENAKRNELPSKDSVVTLLQHAGVNMDSKILLCYESERLISRTARVYLTLMHAGFSENAFVLNGGLPAWLAEERETTNVAVEPGMGNLKARELIKVTMSAAELNERKWSPELVVLDTRSDEEYRGTPATDVEGAEGGHLEGAYFLPYQTSFREDPSYLFKTESELEKLFQDAGLDRGKTAVVYCGSGIRASVTFLAASHLGYPVLLYDGSYEEWDRLALPLTGPHIPDSVN